MTSQPDAGPAPGAGSAAVALAVGAEALKVAGRLLHDFNTEYDEPTPGAAALAARLEQVVADGSTEVLLAGPAEGLAVLRFRPSLWSSVDECYLAELYVVPKRRGDGLGRALLRAGVDRARERGCDFIDLSTSEDDVAARHLYELEGFRRTEGDGGPLAFHYEREL
jgi:ribosomal protein S18 acetylase RimI-like enzyme